MKRSTLVMVLCLVLAVAMGVGSTMAYLQDTDADVNVMTLGSVYITQNEQERVDAKKLPTKDNLKEFEQKKDLYPAVFAGSSIPYDAKSYADNNHDWKVVEYNENVVDKFVTVTNTGKSDAYVRTIVAYEGDAAHGPKGAFIHVVHNGDNAELTTPIDVEWVGYVTIDEVEYTAYVYTYAEALAPGETSIPSLKQVYMNKNAGNKEMEYYGEEYDIRVLSQAVQTMGFTDVNDNDVIADDALDAAFGEVTVDNVEKWFADWKEEDIGSPGDKWPDNNPPITDAIYVTNLDEFKDALAKGGYIILSEDITMDDMIRIEEGVEVTLNMNGKTIDFERNSSFKPGNPLFYPLTGSKLVITGNGTVDLEDNYDAALVYPAGEVVIENGTFIRDRVPEGTSPNDVQTLFIGVKSVGSSVVIKDGYFDGGYYDKNAEAAFDETDADIANRGKSTDKNAYRMAIKNNVSLLINLSWSSDAGTQDFRIYGGTFVGANPAWGDEGCAMPITPDYLRPWSYYQGMFLEGQKMYDDKIEIPAGYTITEGTHSDGRPTFTVNYAE